MFFKASGPADLVYPHLRCATGMYKLAYREIQAEIVAGFFTLGLLLQGDSHEFISTNGWFGPRRGAGKWSALNLASPHHLCIIAYNGRHP